LLFGVAVVFAAAAIAVIFASAAVVIFAAVVLAVVSVRLCCDCKIRGQATRSEIAPLESPPGGNISSPRRLYFRIIQNGFAGGKGYFSPLRREIHPPHKNVPKKCHNILNELHG